MKTLLFGVALACVIVIQVKASEIDLTRFSQSIHSDVLIHTIPVLVGKQHFRVALQLNQPQSWIKSNKCFLCKSDKCREMCQDRIGPSEQGLICSKGSCMDAQSLYNSTVLEGQQLKLTIKAGNKVIKNVSIAAADKIRFDVNNSHKQFDGVFGLLSSDAVFPSFSLFSKGKQLKLIINDQIPKQYIDKKEQNIVETLSNDRSFKVQGISLDNQTIYIEYIAYVNLQSKSIILPEPCFEQLKNKVAVLQPECKISEKKLTCENSKSLGLIKDIVFGIQLPNHKIEFPFSSMTQNCRTKQCDLLVQQSKQMTVLLGEPFLMNYGVNYNLTSDIITFHRLSNLLSTKYHELIKSKGQISTDNDEFPQTVGGFIWHFIRILFKIGMVIGLYYFMLQFYLNYKQVIQKIRNFWSRKQSLYRSPYSPANQDEFSNGGSLMGTDAESAAKEFWEDNTIEGI